MTSDPRLRIAGSRVVAATLLATLAACAGDSKSRPMVDLGTLPVPSHEEFAPVELTGTLFYADSSLGTPGQLAATGNALWIVDYSGSPWLHLVNAADGRLIRTLGKSGEGPGDFEHISSITAIDSTGSIWVFDANPGRMTRVDTTHTALVTPPIVSFDVPGGRIRRGIALGPAAFVGLQTVSQDTAHIVIVSEDGKLKAFADWPLLGPDSVPRAERMKASSAFSTSLCARPDGAGLGIAYSIAGQVDLFDASGTLTEKADVPFPSAPVFVKRATGEIRADRPRFWYSSCAATNDHYYALFSGRLNAAFTDQTDNEAEYIHVFNWKGDLVRVYHLDRTVGQIAVDASGKTLFAVSSELPQVFRFSLP